MNYGGRHNVSKLIRKKNRRYVNELAYYCNDCHVLFVSSNCIVTQHAKAMYNPKTKTYSFKERKDIKVTHTCNICGEDIENNIVLIPQNILKQYWELLKSPLQINIEMSKLRSSTYIEEQLEAYVFDMSI